MGWNIDIKTDKPMTEKVIDEVIKSLPKGIKSGYYKHHGAAWSIVFDVRIEGERLLKLSGSYGCSGRYAEGGAEAFARQLERRGYFVEVGEMH